MLKKIDEAVFRWFQSHHTEGFTYFFRDITSFGGPTGSILIFLFSSIIIFLLDGYKLLAINTITFLITALLITVIKLVVNRPRPLPYNPDVHGLSAVPQFPSFPSGHTVMSLVLYGMLGLSVGRMFPQLHAFLIGCILTFPIVIGLSRLYLGAHWLTDVIAGYILGLILLHCWMLTLASFG